MGVQWRTYKTRCAGRLSTKQMLQCPSNFHARATGSVSPLPAKNLSCTGTRSKATYMPSGMRHPSCVSSLPAMLSSVARTQQQCNAAQHSSICQCLQARVLQLNGGPKKCEQQSFTVEAWCRQVTSRQLCCAETRLQTWLADDGRPLTKGMSLSAHSEDMYMLWLAPKTPEAIEVETTGHYPE